MGAQYVELVKCPVCGRKFKRTRGGRGALRTMCKGDPVLDEETGEQLRDPKTGKLVWSESCRKLAAALVTLEKHLVPVMERATPEKRTEIRGRIWYRANMVPWNKGVPNRYFKKDGEE